MSNDNQGQSSLISPLVIRGTGKGISPTGTPYSWKPPRWARPSKLWGQFLSLITAMRVVSRLKSQLLCTDDLRQTGSRNLGGCLLTTQFDHFSITLSRGSTSNASIYHFSCFPLAKWFANCLQKAPDMLRSHYRGTMDGQKSSELNTDVGVHGKISFL